MDYVYVDDETQISYSTGRAALGEWMRGRDRWHFMGWLWDGQVRDRAHALELAREWVGQR